MVAGQSRNGTVVGGFTFFSEKTTGHLSGFAMIGNAGTAVAPFIARIGTSAVLQIFFFL